MHLAVYWSWPTPGYACPGVYTLVSTCLSLVSLLVPFLLHLSPLVTHLSRTAVDTLGGMFLHLSPVVSLCLSLARYSWPEALGRVVLHLLHLSTLVSDLSRPTLITLGRMFLHLSPLSPLVSLLVSLLTCSWPDAFTLVSHLFRPTLDTLGRMFLDLSPLVDALRRTIAKLITICVTNSWWVESC